VWRIEEEEAQLQENVWWIEKRYNVEVSVGYVVKNVWLLEEREKFFRGKDVVDRGKRKWVVGKCVEKEEKWCSKERSGDRANSTMGCREQRGG
jgi:hypothetical protein